MESPQPFGRDVERCRECRGHLVQVGGEVACTSCGVVARKDAPVTETPPARQTNSSRRLGSYMGSKADENSTEAFNGNSTVGHVKRLSDGMGHDQTAWHSSAMIRRAADRLSLPAFVRENAVTVAGKMLTERKENEGPKSRHTSIPAISAYALLSACRAAGMDHISAKSVIQTFANMGHRVTRSRLLRLGTESQVPLRPADPMALLRTVLGALESNGAVTRKLGKSGVEPGQYFRRLLQSSQTVVGAVRRIGEGRSPRTLAAGSVYLASRELGPKAITQKDVATALEVAEYTVREFVDSVRRELGLSPLNGAGR